MRLAVFDLGTNVFNLLLAELPGDGTSRCLFVRKAASKIGDAAVDGMLTEEAYSRAVRALDVLFGALDEAGGADRYVICCTSAIREALNGREFAGRLSERYGHEFTVIPGEREAELIYKGVRDSLPCISGRVLIMDIGGGSNEFIIADETGILWKRSFRLGMAYLRQKFPPSEPITARETEAVEAYCDNELKELWKAVSEYAPTSLIGTSGSFDTFRDLLTECKSGDSLSFRIPYSDFMELHRRLVGSVREQRLAMPGMSQIRVDYIVLASVFTMLVLQRTGITEISQSSYSLKEGVVAEQKQVYKG